MYFLLTIVCEQCYLFSNVVTDSETPPEFGIFMNLTSEKGNLVKVTRSWKDSSFKLIFKLGTKNEQKITPRLNQFTKFKWGVNFCSSFVPDLTMSLKEGSFRNLVSFNLGHIICPWKKFYWYVYVKVTRSQKDPHYKLIFTSGPKNEQKFTPHLNLFTKFKWGVIFPSFLCPRHEDEKGVFTKSCYL